MFVTALTRIGGDEHASESKCPSGLGGGEELGPVVGLVAKTLVICKYPPKLRIIALALVDQHPR